MFLVLSQGFLLGLAYVAPIGVQNIYVINSGIRLKRTKAYAVAFIIAFFDISLALACYFGVGLLLENNEMLKQVVLLLGSIAMLIIGIQLIRAKHTNNKATFKEQSIPMIFLTGMIVTWFNPQAIIDGTLLLGGFRATIEGGVSNWFIIGVSIASLSWFLFVITITSFLKSSFTDKTLKVISIICGIVILFFAFKLGYTFILSIT